MDNFPSMTIHLIYFGKGGLSEKLRELRIKKRFFSDKAITINECAIMEKADSHNDCHVQVKIDGGGQSFVVQGWVNTLFLQIGKLTKTIIAEHSLQTKSGKKTVPYFISIDNTL